MTRLADAATPARIASRARALVWPPRQRPSARGPLPTFLVIGAQKSGTRWLRHNLALHPEVYLAPSELHYFTTRRYRQGIDWYRAQFGGWRGELAVGESTPDYLLPRRRPYRAAERIDRDLPGVRLLAILRDPCERAYSAFIHHMSRHRIDAATDLLEYVKAREPDEDRLQLVSGGRYAANLAPYLERFGARVLVVLTEDVRDDAEGVYRRVAAHIGVETSFVPTGVAQRRFSNPTPRRSKYADGHRRRALTPDERRELLPYFLNDIERLEELLGRDLRPWKAAGPDED